jgi:hypothetical protein
LRKSWRSDCPPGSAGVVTGASKSLRSARRFAIPGGTWQAAEAQARGRFLRATGAARGPATGEPTTNREPHGSCVIRGPACALAAGPWREPTSGLGCLTRGASRIGSRGENARKFEGFGASRGSMMGRRARHIGDSLPARSGVLGRAVSQHGFSGRWDRRAALDGWRKAPHEAIVAIEAVFEARNEAHFDPCGSAAQGRGAGGTRFASVPGRICFTRGVMPAIEENAG